MIRIYDVSRVAEQERPALILHRDQVEEAIVKELLLEALTLINSGRFEELLK